MRAGRWRAARLWPAAINIGPNPTFGEQAMKVEVHLIDFQGSLYGEPLEVDFFSRLRDIQRFDDVPALLAQIQSDVAEACRRAAREPPPLNARASVSLLLPAPCPLLPAPMPIDWPRFTEIVRSHQRFVLTSHIRPDCDALGSELGMAGVLEALGKNVRIVNGQSTPPNLLFLDPRRPARSDRRRRAAGRAGRSRSADGARHQRLGPIGADGRRGSRDTAAKKVVLDHHVSSDDLGAEMFKDTDGRSDRPAGAASRRCNLACG